MDSPESEVYRVRPHGMRLINTETVELQRFPEDSIPPYAILSHIWGHQDDECRFQDFNDTKQHSEQLRSKRGYAKVINFCRKAQEHGHTWAWADTVCIDKTSYEELNTAINCMFAWYEQSEVCFAYLDNVEYCGPVIDIDNLISEQFRAQRGSVLSAIKRWSWFQRGWTLQEFIAPVRLSFFSREWTFLFARDDTSRGLESIAHVPHSFCFRRQGLVVKKRADLLAGYTAAEKMRWASGRLTRYPEDEAYCLLGIFGVQMPIRYGEGAHAFERLQSLVMNVTRDPTLLIWSQTNAWSTPHGLASTSYLATKPSDFRKIDFESKYDLWLDMSRGRKVTTTAASFYLDRSFIIHRPLVPTLDDRVGLIAMGQYESPFWVEATNEARVFVPVISAGGSRHRRANLPIVYANERSSGIMFSASPTEIRLDNVSGTITQDVSGSSDKDPNGSDTESVKRVLVTFPLGFGGFSFLAAFPGMDPSAPGTISMTRVESLHCAVLVYETRSPFSRAGFLFLTEAGYYPHRTKRFTCRVLKEAELRDVSKLGLQQVLEHHANCISSTAQKHNAQNQAIWRRRDHFGDICAEIGDFTVLCSGSKGNESCGNDKPNEDEHRNIPEDQEHAFILTAQVVFNCPKTQVRQKMAAFHHANGLNYD